MEEEAAAMAAVSIPNDDVLLEILVQVKDAAALFRCATVCKQWHALITEPSFLQRRLLRLGRPLYLGRSNLGGSIGQRAALYFLGALLRPGATVASGPRPPHPQLLHVQCPC